MPSAAIVFIQEFAGLRVISEEALDGEIGEFKARGGPQLDQASGGL